VIIYPWMHTEISNPGALGFNFVGDSENGRNGGEWGGHDVVVEHLQRKRRRRGTSWWPPIQYCLIRIRHSSSSPPPIHTYSEIFNCDCNQNHPKIYIITPVFWLCCSNELKNQNLEIVGNAGNWRIKILDRKERGIRIEMKT